MPNSQKTFQTLVFGHEEVLVLYSKIYHFFGFWDFCHVFKGCPIFSPSNLCIFSFPRQKQPLHCFPPPHPVFIKSHVQHHHFAQLQCLHICCPVSGIVKTDFSQESDLIKNCFQSYPGVYSIEFPHG